MVTFVCDSGNKYLSKMFSDHWMEDQGFLAAARTVISRLDRSPASTEGAVVCVAPSEPLSIAYARMRLYDVSQVPVLDGRAIVGILDESDLLVAVSRDPRAFDEPVSQHMTTRLQTVSPQRLVGSLLSDLRGRSRGDRR